MEALGSATESRDQFMQLLVTQLRHQDPLSPVKQEDFLAQLAQFSTLEGIEKLNHNFEGFLASQTESQETQNSLLVELQQFENMTSAADLIGKEIEYATSDGAKGEKEKVLLGKVEAVVIQDDGISVRVGDDLVPFNQIREIVGGESNSHVSARRQRVSGQ